MAPFEERLEAARAFNTDARIRVTGIERDLGTRYTKDTLDALKKAFSARSFRVDHGRRQPGGGVPLEGLARHIPHGSDCGFRPSLLFFEGVVGASGAALQRCQDSRIPRRAGWANMRPPAWVFLNRPRNPASATRIRSGR